MNHNWKSKFFIGLLGVSFCIITSCDFTHNSTNDKAANNTSSTDFITTWGPIDASTSITISVVKSRNYHFSINWGDGSPTQTFEGKGKNLDVKHTYSISTPTIDISITPLENLGKTGFPQIKWGDTYFFPANGEGLLLYDCSKLLNIKQWGATVGVYGQSLWRMF